MGGRQNKRESREGNRNERDRMEGKINRKETVGKQRGGEEAGDNGKGG